MASFMLRSHGPNLGKFLSPFIFELTTWGRVQEYNQGLHPEAVRIFGQNYISFADQVNPLITLLTIPVFYYIARRIAGRWAPKISLLFMLLVSTQVWMMLFGDAIELWFFAPLTALLAVCIPLLLAGSKRRTLTYLYFGLVALWPLFAYCIILLRLYSAQV